MNLWLIVLTGSTLAVAIAAFAVELLNRKAILRADRHGRDLQNEVEMLRSTTLAKVQTRVQEVDTRLLDLSEAFDVVRRNVEAMQAATHNSTAARPAEPQAFQRQEMSPQEAMDLTRRLYGEWCRKGRRPDLPPDFEAVPLRYVRSEQKDELAEPVHLFEDAGQTAEFVRFSRKNRSDRSAVFPHPETTYRNAIRYLFDGLSEGQFGALPRPHLASTEPVSLSRRPDGKWVRNA